jgi:hypothetical protein
MSIGGLHKKLWPPKVIGVPILGNFGTTTWESQDKMTLGVGIVLSTEYIIRVKVVASPQVRTVVRFVDPCMHVARLCTKSSPKV